MAHRLGVATLCLSVFAILLSCAAQAEAGASQLTPEYKRWLNEDVRWIITDQELTDFLHLATDSDRDKFVVNFWEHRNPTPGSKTNLFKEEHYRRLEFVNKHFAADLAGWQTDRGRIYIVYGPPDRIDERPAVGFKDDVVNGSARPYQIWHYKHLNGVGDDQDIKFVDVCSCGDYRTAAQ